MRMWSISPAYLDPPRLVAGWREVLGAREALKGNVEGYKNHSQLRRFWSHDDPVTAINIHLWFMYYESVNRGYNFDPSKLEPIPTDIEPYRICVPRGQVLYEAYHLDNKIQAHGQFEQSTLLNDDLPNNLVLHPLYRMTIDLVIPEWEVKFHREGSVRDSFRQWMNKLGMTTSGMLLTNKKV